MAGASRSTGSSRRGEETDPAGRGGRRRRLFLEGWDSVPLGYTASFRLSDAPLWLRIWFRLPLIDRFAYPVAVRRGFGYLEPVPGWPRERFGSVAPGWHVTHSEW